MRPTTRTIGIAVMCSVLALSGTATATAETGTVDTVKWTPCPEKPDVECGTVTVPVDWAKPKGEKMGVAIARRKATDPAKRVGSLLIDPGGPGGSGVEFAFGADQYFSPEIAQKFDIVGFDPRGVARSNPILCSRDLVRSGPRSVPATAVEYEKLKAYNTALRDDCRKRSGAIYDHASTADVAQDMDAIRRALGEKKINYYGISYGTIMGQHYAERFGRNIRAMIIDSNMDHSLALPRFVTTEARTVEDSFQEFLKWNDRTAASPLHGQDVSKIWFDLLARADRGELSAPDDPSIKLTADDLAGLAIGQAYGPDWPFFADTIVALNLSKPAPAAFADDAVNFPVAAIACNDYDLNPRGFGEFQALMGLGKLISPHTRGRSVGSSVVTACVGAPPASNPQRPLNIRNAPKILMENARHDPATAYEWAVNAHRQSADSTVFVTYDGWGHGVYTRSECTRAINDRYLVDLKLPAEGTHCAAVEPVAGVSAKVAGPVLPVRPWALR